MNFLQVDELELVFADVVDSEVFDSVGLFSDSVNTAFTNISDVLSSFYGFTEFIDTVSSQSHLITSPFITSQSTARSEITTKPSSLLLFSDVPFSYYRKNLIDSVSFADVTSGHNQYLQSSVSDFSLSDSVFSVSAKHDNLSDDLILNESMLPIVSVSKVFPLMLIDDMVIFQPAELSDVFGFGSDDTSFEVEKAGILVDLLELSSSLSSQLIALGSILTRLLYTDEPSSLCRYNQSIADKLSINSFSLLQVISSITDKLTLLDILGKYYAEFLQSVIALHSIIKSSLHSEARDVVYIGDKGRCDVLLSFRERYGFDDSISGLRKIFSDVFSKIELSDLVDFVRDVLLSAVYLYVNFYMPERWSIIEERAGCRSDTIFCLEDGLYELDFSKKVDDTALVLNLNQLATSKVKRIDKIYYDSKPSEVRIYTEEDVYNLEGEENYVSVPKGIRGKELKIGLYGMKEVEYVDVGLILEKRSKL